MATDLVAIENLILAKLQPLAAIYNVAIGKLDAHELKRPVVGGQVFVNYAGFDSESPITFNGQEVRSYKYQVLVRFVNLRTHDQAYPLLGAIATALSKFVPIARLTVKPMNLQSEKPDTTQVADGIWIYVQNYNFQILEV